MYNFTFHRPTTVRQAAGLLARNPEAKLLAGGHSILPVMKQRLAQPSALIDLALVEGLSGVEQKGRSIVIGAMTRHADAANSPVLQQLLPGLAAVPASVGDPQVRNRGTIGGSIANNDPNADYPAACLGLGATIITNKRRIAADDFFTGMFSTALEDGEIITKVSFPIAKKAAYEKFKHPGEDGERGNGAAAHGVDVAERVGGGDGAEGVRIVDDGREEIHGMHEGELRRQFVDAGIVGGIKPDQHVFIRPARYGGQHLVQQLWTQLGRSTRSLHVGCKLLNAASRGTRLQITH